MTFGPGLASVTGMMRCSLSGVPHLLITPFRAGETHRRQRRMLTPVFSAKHLRTIVPIFHRVTDKARSATHSCDVFSDMFRISQLVL